MSINLSEDLKKVKVLLDYTDEELASELGVNRSTLVSGSSIGLERP